MASKYSSLIFLLILTVCMTVATIGEDFNDTAMQTLNSARILLRRLFTESIHVPLATTALSLMGYITVDCNWTAIYIITSEIFPTVLRNTAQGVGSTTARIIGAILAPYISMMSQLPGLGIAFPVTIFGVLALIGGMLMYWLPETLYAPMHQTIGEAEAAEEDFSIPCCGKRRIAGQGAKVAFNSDEEQGEHELTKL